MTLPQTTELKYAMRFADGRAFHGVNHVLLFGMQNSGRPTVAAIDKKKKQVEYTEQPAFDWPSPKEMPYKPGGSKK